MFVLSSITLKSVVMLPKNRENDRELLGKNCVKGLQLVWLNISGCCIRKTLTWGCFSVVSSPRETVLFFCELASFIGNTVHGSTLTRFLCTCLDGLPGNFDLPIFLGTK